MAKYLNPLRRAPCPRCLKTYRNGLTRHHVPPLRFYGDTAILIYICRSCHDLLEQRIPKAQKLPLFFYVDVVMDFLKLTPEMILQDMAPKTVIGIKPILEEVLKDRTFDLDRKAA